MSERSQVIASKGVNEGPAATDEPFGVYIHWPFCAQKCPYCDFNSHVRHGGWDEAALLEAYLREISWTREQTGPRTVSSVFFGGGTPSLMAPETAGRVLEAVFSEWSRAEDCEVTLEGNPGSVEAGKYADFRNSGINRASIGVQSLRESDLRRLGRIHSVGEALRAVEIANATFDRVSFDLIYAREGQTVAEWRLELAEALAMASGHLSLYQLTIEPGTPFARWYEAGRLSIPDDETAAAFFELTQELCEAAGLPAYETSNHARPGEESRHNLIYWRYQPYAGIGPGAHGRLQLADGTRVATVTEAMPEAWVTAVGRSGNGLVDMQSLSGAQCADEALLMGLRLREGVDLDRLARMAGLVPAGDGLDQLIADGLLIRCGGRLAATPKGRFVLDSVVLQLSDALTPARMTQVAG